MSNTYHHTSTKRATDSKAKEVTPKRHPLKRAVARALHKQELKQLHSLDRE